MSKKALKVAGSVVAIGLAGYFGGVYYTSYKINEILSNLNEVVSPYFASSNLEVHTDYKLQEQGLFNSSALLDLKVEDKSYLIALTIHNGFLNSKINADTKKLNEFFSQNQKFIKDSVKSDLSILANALTSKLEVELEAKADYKNGATAFKLDSNLQLQSNGSLSYQNVVDNFDYQDVFFGKVSYQGQLKLNEDFSKLKNLGQASLVVNNLNTPLFSSKVLNLSFDTYNYKDNGNFDIRYNLQGDSLHYLQNYDIALELESLNLKYFENLTKDNLKAKELLKDSLHTIRFKKLNLTLNDSLGMFIGVNNLRAHPLVASGLIEMGNADELSSYKGSFEIETDNIQGLERYFVTDNGKNICKLGFENGKFLLNGKVF